MTKRFLVLSCFFYLLSSYVWSDDNINAISIATELSMTKPRAAHSATQLLDGRILLIGGMSESINKASDTVEVYLPDEKKFKSLANFPIKIQNHTATLLGDGQVLIVGGFDGTQIQRSVFLFNPKTNQFSRHGSLNRARMSHRAIRLADGSVLVTGGVGSGANALASAEIYEPDVGRFRELNHDMKKLRTSHQLVLLNDGKVAVIGGYQGQGRSALVHPAIEIFNPIDERFTLVAEMKQPRHSFAAIKLVDGRIAIFAGSNSNDWRGRMKLNELYDPVTKQLNSLAATHSKRFKHQDAVALLNDGKVLLLGGANVPEVFDPAENSFKPLPVDLGGEYADMVILRLNNGDVLATGGYDRRGQITAKAWLFFQ